MKYYFEPENRIIETEELIRKYGSEFPIKELGIFYLTNQPDYDPVAFNKVGDMYYPVESYVSMRNKAIDALMRDGHTREEAEAILD